MPGDSPWRMLTLYCQITILWRSMGSMSGGGENKFTKLYFTSGGEHLNPQNSHQAEDVFLFLPCKVQIFLISNPLLSSVTFWTVFLHVHLLLSDFGIYTSQSLWPSSVTCIMTSSKQVWTTFFLTALPYFIAFYCHYLIFYKE